jgi:hypothetical protein
MSQFTGEGRRVRCADCLHLQGKTCVGRKDTPTVSPKKKRSCGSYGFKGEYQNSTPLEATYIPYIDPKTKKLMKKLMKLGVVPVTDRDLQEGGMRKIVVPASTATASLPGIESQDMEKVSGGQDFVEKEEESLIWTPDKGDE